MRFTVVCLFLALAVFSGSCARFMSGAPDEQAQSQQPGPFKAAQELQKNGRFSDAVAAYRTILSQNPDMKTAAAAQYGIALLYVAPANPEKDYAQAMTEFDEFIRRFPQNHRIHEAKSWSLALKTALETKKENERLTRNIERLKQLDVKQEERRLGR